MNVRPNPTLKRASALEAPPWDELEPELPALPVAEGMTLVTSVPKRTGGFVVLSLVSIYALARGIFRHDTTGSMVKGGW